eukprot:g62826.t1
MFHHRFGCFICELFLPLSSFNFRNKSNLCVFLLVFFGPVPPFFRFSGLNAPYRVPVLFQQDYQVKVRSTRAAIDSPTTTWSSTWVRCPLLYIFDFVSFSLVFRTVPSAFLSCRVLKQDHPCLRRQQPSNSPPAFSCVLLRGLSFCRSIPACVVPWMSPSSFLAPALLAKVRSTRAAIESPNDVHAFLLWSSRWVRCPLLYLFDFVSFSLVFRIVLSCRVLKQDHPACVASNQATCPPLLSRVFYYVVFLPLHTRMRRSLDEPFFSRACALGKCVFCSPPQVHIVLISKFRVCTPAQSVTTPQLV